MSDGTEADLSGAADPVRPAPDADRDGIGANAADTGGAETGGMAVGGTETGGLVTGGVDVGGVDVGTARDDGGPDVRVADTPAGEPATAGSATVDPPAGAAAESETAATLRRLADRMDELTALRRHDVELVDRLHAENVRLRAGELSEAMTPLLRGLIRLHDQMSSLGGDDAQSVAGILRTQLLQILDLAADTRPYTVESGSSFDPALHVGVRRVPTDDPALDRTVARTVRPGFMRGESTVVRPAKVEVYRAA